ncbi:trihelix transcription factor ASR3-like isoform X2 [Zingiber officinale]|uniref:trihelix transcription factor ASR3-like isoform X2 n=1 Tax=Zingiber officinale TaxID=94328 RepID=UPI001C4CB7CF|nr:trihelix transcription factor ASR3-like isoform X2 [Zingiber officinale]
MSNDAAWSSRMGGERAGGNGGAVGHRPPRRRWWNREILVMLEGKRAVEARDRDPFVAVPAETKWEAVSSYCRQKEVYRSSEQCRRRWGTLMNGYRKIRAWETRDGAAAGNSYWTMGSQERKDRRLPGIFEGMLYRILEADVESDGRVGDVGERMQEDEEEDNEDGAEASFSSNQDATESGSFSYADQVNVIKDLPSPIAATPISMRKFEPSQQEFADPAIFGLYLWNLGRCCAALHTRNYKG